MPQAFLAFGQDVEHDSADQLVRMKEHDLGLVVVLAIKPAHQDAADTISPEDTPVGECAFGGIRC